MKLGRAANIRTGLFAKPMPRGTIAYLQGKDFDDRGVPISTPEPELGWRKAVTKHLLKPGDILFAAKGTKNFAWVFRDDFPAVASTTFFVITIRDATLLPEYLAWKLNEPTTLAILQKYARGSSLVSIPKSLLEELDLDIPSVEKQKLVIEIDRLGRNEADLYLKIAALRQTLLRRQLADAVNK